MMRSRSTKFWSMTAPSIAKLPETPKLDQMLSRDLGVAGARRGHVTFAVLAGLACVVQVHDHWLFVVAMGPPAAFAGRIAGAADTWQTLSSLGFTHGDPFTGDSPVVPPDSSQVKYRAPHRDAPKTLNPAQSRLTCSDATTADDKVRSGSTKSQFDALKFGSSISEGRHCPPHGSRLQPPTQARSFLYKPRTAGELAGLTEMTASWRRVRKGSLGYRRFSGPSPCGKRKWHPMSPSVGAHVASRLEHPVLHHNGGPLWQLGSH